MGTKNNPGSFDCYGKADPDEPLFVLRGKDPCASFIVKLWAQMRCVAGVEDKAATEARIGEALRCAATMKEWAEKAGKNPEALTAAFRQACSDALSDQG